MSISELLGIWRLVSFEMEDVTSGERHLIFGENPRGFLNFTPEGRVFAILTSSSRRPPISDSERARAFLDTIAYTGKYRIENDKFIANIDVSWAEQLVGMERVQTYVLKGDRLNIVSSPTPHSLYPGKMLRALLEWKRENPEF